MQTIEYEGITLGDMVLYNDPNKGYVPAIIESIYPPQDEDDPPELALVVLITGYAGCAFPVSRAKFGKEKGNWILREQGRDFAIDPDKALSDVQKKHLAALDELAELSREEETTQDPPEQVPPPAQPEAEKQVAPPAAPDGDSKPEAEKPKKPPAK